ncbi:MAG: transporter ATP-binding protein [Bacilli bacterium]|nr:transporter ATP-binding protein [Bacilli bacterium]
MTESPLGVISSSSVPLAEGWLLEAQSIACEYFSGNTRVVAVDSATCKIKAGDRIALVGPSGSGKSTLLQLLGGLEAPTSGILTWPLLGDRTNLRPMNIGFIFQTQSLLPPLSVVENVELPLLLTDMNRKQAREMALEALSRIRLEHLANKLPEELSGGQSQRVAVARVIACRPKLILADEPTGQLDYATADHLFNVLLSTLDYSDTALIVATHDIKIAQRLDTQWFMKQGRLEVDTSC